MSAPADLGVTTTACRVDRLTKRATGRVTSRYYNLLGVKCVGEKRVIDAARGGTQPCKRLLPLSCIGPRQRHVVIRIERQQPLLNQHIKIVHDRFAFVGA